jgi:hypothetical protein
MKAAITKKYTISASGILDIREEGIGVEIPETGEWVDLRDLLSDFNGRTIKFSANYDEDYSSED